MAPDGNLAKDLIQLEVSKKNCDAEVSSEVKIILSQVSSYHCFIFSQVISIL